MDKEKQIDKMARDMCGLGRDCHGCTSSMSYVCKAKKYAERAVDKGYSKKSDVAREIFEEIERTFKGLLKGDISDILKLLSTLKKKYAEEQK